MRNLLHLFPVIISLTLATMAAGCLPQPESNTPSCMNLQEQEIERNPIEEGKAAYIWPDDRNAYGCQYLHELTKWVLEDGDTLYIRPGVYEESIYAVDLTVMERPMKRIHVRGAGPNIATLKGFIWAGGGSTIKNLTVDNTGIGMNQTAIDIYPPGVTIENVIVVGGRNGLLVGTDLLGGVARSGVILSCVVFTDFLYSGIALGDEIRRVTIPYTQITNVTVGQTGGMGLAICGDNAMIDSLNLFQIGANGLAIDGGNAQIMNSSIDETGAMGLIIHGDNATVDNLQLSQIGTTGLAVYGGRVQITNSSIAYAHGGLAIHGDDAMIDNLDLFQIGGGGLLIDGANAQIMNGSITSAGLYGAAVDGPGIRMENMTIDDIGTSEVGTGIILYENSMDYLIKDCLFRSMRVGISLSASINGDLVHNTFTDVLYEYVVSGG